MQRLLYLSIALFAIFWNIEGRSQGVSINGDNSSPAPSAILDVKSTSQGVLFPRMTTSQRDAISSPADGLHIFNTTNNSLEYYDSVFASWTSYCKDCGVFYDTIIGEVTHYTLPAEAAGFYKIQILIDANAVLVGGAGDNIPAIDFQSANPGASILIYNHGNIIGRGGDGGKGGGFTVSPECAAEAAHNGFPGGDAIFSKSGTKLKIYNYGIIAGGGGGGGGGGAGSSYPDAGGGGGAGAGCLAYSPNSGGYHGVKLHYEWVINGYYCMPDYSTLGEDGQSGTLLAGGLGGNGGQSGSPLFAGYAGGNGGGIGQAGQNGVASFYNPGGLGGQPGKAIGGNPGNNTVINSGSGSLIGVVD